MKKQAFTLAEVLLTLAIIGVVAALTIPAVITKVAKDQYVTGLKKAFNTLKSVQGKAEQENGRLDVWTWTNTLADFDKYFKPHFDILKDCGTGTDEGCFADKYTTMKNDIAAEDYSSGAYAKIMTSDGISYAYIPGDLSQKGRIYVDINGKKGPNKWGRDMFRFVIWTNTGIVPSGLYASSGNIAVPFPTASLNADCSASGTGAYCAGKVLSEGAMNY